MAAVSKLVAFYVGQHNTQLPHLAFRGQTPNEMYFGTGATIPENLQKAHLAARQTRLIANCQSTCQTWLPEPVLAGC